jgi:hypothetical protein
MMDLNLNHIERICQETDDRVWSAYLKSTGDNSDTLYDPRLMFSGETRKGRIMCLKKYYWYC